MSYAAIVLLRILFRRVRDYGWPNTALPMACWPTAQLAVIVSTGYGVMQAVQCIALDFAAIPQGSAID